MYLISYLLIKMFLGTEQYGYWGVKNIEIIFLFFIFKAVKSVSVLSHLNLVDVNSEKFQLISTDI